MKKYILAFLTIVLFTFPAISLAWDDCPYGETDCSGLCGDYIDTNVNDICDKSELLPEIALLDSSVVTDSVDEGDIHDLVSGKDVKNYTVESLDELYAINAHDFAHKLSDYLGVKVEPWDEFSLLHNNYDLAPSLVKDIAVALNLGEEINIDALQKENTKENIMVYHLWPISLALVIFYFLTWFLTKKKIIKFINHRRFWNILLLLTFLGSGILGILLIFRINSGIITPMPFNILYWHVEIGIAMFIISIFHTIWHWNYFKLMFLRNKK